MKLMLCLTVLACAAPLPAATASHPNIVIILANEWDDKIAAFDPQADLAKRIANHHNNEKKKASGQPPPSDLRPGPVADKNRPGCCYAGVIQPLAGLAVRMGGSHFPF